MRSPGEPSGQTSAHRATAKPPSGPWVARAGSGDRSAPNEWTANYLNGARGGARSRRQVASLRAISWLAAGLCLLAAGWLAPVASEQNVINIKIGALLEERDHEQANMFIRTIKMINERGHETIARLLAPSNFSAGLTGNDRDDERNRPANDPAGWSASARASQQPRMVVKLEPMIEFLGDRSSSSVFEADNRVCQLIESGANAILGPLEGPSIQHVQSICDNTEIPYFELRPFAGSPVSLSIAGSATGVASQQRPSSAGKTDEDLTLNLFPPANVLTGAYIDLISAWNWTSFAIVYEDPASLIKLQNLFRESSPDGWSSRWRIKLFQLQQPRASGTGQRPPPEARFPSQEPPPSAAPQSSKASSFRSLFWQVRESGEQNIMLDIRTDRLAEALRHAQQVGCMTERFSYLVTSLDLHTIDLESFCYSRTKLTGFSLIQLPRNSDSAEQLDERYLERLGVHVMTPEQPPSRAASILKGTSFEADRLAVGSTAGGGGYKLSPSVVLDKTGQYMEPPTDIYYKDHSWGRREQQLASLSPASMGVLPALDRQHERRLYEFFIEQQARNMSHLRLATASAILHDALLLYSLALRDFDPTGSLLSSSGSSSCAPSSAPWPHGSSLANYMRRLSFTGLTGPLSFDQRGQRSKFKLDLVGVAPQVGLIKVGEWHSEPVDRQQLAEGSDAPTATASSRNYEEQAKFYSRELDRYRRLLAEGKPISVSHRRLLSPRQQETSEEPLDVRPPQSVSRGSLLVNDVIYEQLYGQQEDQVDTLIVTTKLSQPYFMLKETPNKLVGNDQYEGFAVDLIHELSKLVNFRYKWREVADKKYGSKEILANGTVQWNGMIGEIVRGQADLAIVDLTITAQREEAVDFTLPFMNTGISILFKKPTTKVTTLFSFLSPFSSDVWAYVLAAYCGISAILFLVGHLSPYEWADPRPCRHSASLVPAALASRGLKSDKLACLTKGFSFEGGATEEPEDCVLLKNQFSLLNSFWFTIGSLMQQGSDLTPRSMSTRTIAGIWYFFTLIMISSYTANLAAFLTVEKVVYPIENVRDLSQQQEIKYGCVESGSTCVFFHDSQIDTYKKINETMHKFKTYVKSNDEGQKRVEEGKFAFFMESASIEYIVERNCNLTQIGGLLDSKGYGLATSKKSRLKRPYRTLLSEGILHLQETGMLHVLKNRWWKERRGGGTCTDDGKGGGVTELSLANVGGVFVVLLGGLGISFLVAIAEFMWRARRRGSSRDKMLEQMMCDLKFALACKQSMKPASKHLGRDGTRRQTSQASNDASARSADVWQARGQPQKEPDPILLNAMLAMLMRQQQAGQQMLPNGQLYAGQIPHQQPPVATSSTKASHMDPLLAASQGDVNYLHETRLIDRLPGKQLAQTPLLSKATRRRMLYQQQTIDSSLADDSLLAGLSVPRFTSHGN